VPRSAPMAAGHNASAAASSRRDLIGTANRLVAGDALYMCPVRLCLNLALQANSLSSPRTQFSGRARIAGQ
jgi:hypothetical protein